MKTGGCAEGMDALTDIRAELARRGTADVWRAEGTAFEGALRRVLLRDDGNLVVAFVAVGDQEKRGELAREVHALACTVRDALAHARLHRLVVVILVPEGKGIEDDALAEARSVITTRGEFRVWAASPYSGDGSACLEGVVRLLRRLAPPSPEPGLFQPTTDSDLAGLVDIVMEEKYAGRLRAVAADLEAALASPPEDDRGVWIRTEAEVERIVNEASTPVRGEG